VAHIIRAVCFDSGDTLADEATELGQDVVVFAELIDGAAETVRQVKSLGYPLALIADGSAASFSHVLGHYGLFELFDAVAISETLGVEKPHPEMFQYALRQLGVQKDEYKNVLMIGNNLRRDIGGANALGITSVWPDWSPRRSKVPQSDLEVPDYVIHKPLELLEVIAKVEAGTDFYRMSTTT